MAKSLMIQGTGSGVGKSLIVSGLCRILSDMGIKVAPFKAQNMALNSFITNEGGEIGRAQALQAEASRIEPSVDMNPILLKASGEAGCQVILSGGVHSIMKAHEYYEFKNEAWDAVTRAYKRLSEKYELIVIEGAGSPAEINLSKDEVVNMRVARHTDSPVILVGDIDKGGVFASFYGTIELLKNPPSPPFAKGGMGGLCDADYIKAFIINKFRGDINILNPGLDMIKEKTGKPVLGVIPYLGDMGLHEEDGIPLERLKVSKYQSVKVSKIKIVVLRLRYIANFTDFDPFMYEPDVELIYSLNETDIENADMVIIPGSKNTVKDLLFLRDHGIDRSIERAAEKGIALVGICGGYQMLGKKIYDPYLIESEFREIDGLGLLDIETTLEKTKTTCQVEAEILKPMQDTGYMIHDKENHASCIVNRASRQLRGYEIHMGISTGNIGLFRISRITHYASRITDILDGSRKGNVWGTYIHGIFDNDNFRRNLINSLSIKKGLVPIEEMIDYSQLRDDSLNKWAEIIRKNINMKFIQGLIDG
ncbi:MAG: cobyric acid synthase [Nitrospirae bacterium]|nr:cobyric acid synthase [Nitrospirota bacterium]